MAQKFILPENLGADFRGVGSRIVVDSIVGGPTAPTSPPAEAGKIWQWWHTGLNRITHLWSPGLGGWVPLTPPAVPSIKVVSTDTSSNLAATTETLFSEALGGAEWNDDPDVFELTSSGVILKQAGRYELSGYWSFIARNGGARNCIRLRARLDGDLISPDYQDNYIRDLTGSEESGQGIPPLPFQATAGQALTLHRTRISGTGGNQTLDGANNYFLLRRIGP